MNLRFAAALTGSFAALALLVLGGTYVAARRVPRFYQQALQAAPEIRERQSDELLENAAALASCVRKEGSWRALFTADQINGWLAVDVAKNFPELFPQGVADPRVAIGPDRIAIACRYLDGPVETVLSLEGEAYVQEPNVLSIRILRARAGSLPAPLGGLLKGISNAADKAGMQLHWLQAEGDPVAVIRLQPPRDERNQLRQIETIELRDGEIYLAGRTTSASNPSSHEASAPLAASPDAQSKKR
ncbi:MAG TPA: hypothetical protein VMV10_10565 [Pirellulales bacterium]|nr:hypothetical protein [Pirellulales bacterium]